MKPVQIVIAAILVLVGATAQGYAARQSKYKGKPLSEWKTLADDLDPATRQDACDGVGGNAVNLQTNAMKLEAVMMGLHGEAMKLEASRNLQDLENQAAGEITFLSDSLDQQQNDTVVAKSVLSTFGKINWKKVPQKTQFGAVSVVTAVLYNNDQSTELRVMAVNALGKIAQEGTLSRVVRLVLLRLKDEQIYFSGKDDTSVTIIPTLKDAALSALGRYAIGPKIADVVSQVGGKGPLLEKHRIADLQARNRSLRNLRQECGIEPDHRNADRCFWR